MNKLDRRCLSDVIASIEQLRDALLFSVTNNVTPPAPADLVDYLNAIMVPVSLEPGRFLFEETSLDPHLTLLKEIYAAWQDRGFHESRSDFDEFGKRIRELLK